MKIMTDILTSPIAAIFLSISFYMFGVWLFKKTKLGFIHPLPVAIILVVIVLALFNVDYDTYNNGGKIITAFLGPATVCLAVPLYKNIKKLKENILPILTSTFVGSLISVASVIIMGYFFKLNKEIIISLLPRSVTAPIGMAISEQFNGLISITMLSIVITGTLGAMLAPYLKKWYRVKDDVANGLAFGTSTHAVGTAKALEINELMGSMAGLSLASVGIITTLICEIAIRFIK